MLLNLFKQIPKLSAVRKVLEIIVFLALGSFGTLGPKLSYGTSWIAEIIHWIISPNVRTHLRKVSRIGFSLIKNTEVQPRCFYRDYFTCFASSSCAFLFDSSFSFNQFL